MACGPQKDLKARYNFIQKDKEMWLFWYIVSSAASHACFKNIIRLWKTKVLFLIKVSWPRLLSCYNKFSIDIKDVINAAL